MACVYFCIRKKSFVNPRLFLIELKHWIIIIYAKYICEWIECKIGVKHGKEKQVFLREKYQHFISQTLFIAFHWEIKV